MLIIIEEYTSTDLAMDLGFQDDLGYKETFIIERAGRLSLKHIQDIHLLKLSTLLGQIGFLNPKLIISGYIFLLHYFQRFLLLLKPF